MLFDAHVHLNEERLYKDIDGVLERAASNNVSRFLVPSYDLESIERAIELCRKYSSVYCAIGFHPSDVKKYSFDILELLEKYATTNTKVKAIGEIGLDYYWDEDEETRKRQKVFFIQQIKIANILKLPVIVHMRDASEDTLNILKENPPQFGFMMHCYSGSPEMMKDIIKLGGYISLGGPVTFLNARTPKEIAKEVPLERLLIETDSPYLAPHPLRGHLNEPANITLVCQEIAKIRNMSFEDVAKITSDNAMRFFHVEI